MSALTSAGERLERVGPLGALLLQEPPERRNALDQGAVAFAREDRLLDEIEALLDRQQVGRDAGGCARECVLHCRQAVGEDPLDRGKALNHLRVDRAPFAQSLLAASEIGRSRGAAQPLGLRHVDEVGGATIGPASRPHGAPEITRAAGQVAHHQLAGGMVAPQIDENMQNIVDAPRTARLRGVGGGKP